MKRAAPFSLEKDLQRNGPRLNLQCLLFATASTQKRIGLAKGSRQHCPSIAETFG